MNDVSEQHFELDPALRPYNYNSDDLMTLSFLLLILGLALLGYDLTLLPSKLGAPTDVDGSLAPVFVVLLVLAVILFAAGCSLLITTLQGWAVGSRISEDGKYLVWWRGLATVPANRVLIQDIGQIRVLDPDEGNFQLALLDTQGNSIDLKTACIQAPIMWALAMERQFPHIHVEYDVNAITTWMARTGRGNRKSSRS